VGTTVDLLTAWSGKVGLDWAVPIWPVYEKLKVGLLYLASCTTLVVDSQGVTLTPDQAAFDPSLLWAWVLQGS
jgi:hypothetical protein